MKSAAMWKAAERRDPAFDGAFVFGVVTTGIYCRASCPAKRPLRKNVRLFPTPADAEREGFRACKRCRPAPSLSARACELLRSGRMTLAQLGRRLDVSPAHLQRTFTREIGVSPAAYLNTLRFERFRNRSRREVAPALYDAGFGSTSRLYERSRSRLGMTPATHLRGGPGMTIVYDLFPTPLGKALIAATPAGICAVQFGDDAVQALADRYPKASIRRDAALLRRVTGPLRNFFDLDPNLPLDVKATAFQARVWNELRAIPAGKTRTYSEIARRIGRPRTARAVGAACASNPVAILIPCHRAVGADRQLKGYRWGVGRKKALLEREQCDIPLGRRWGSVWASPTSSNARNAGAASRPTRTSAGGSSGAASAGAPSRSSGPRP